MTIGIAADGKNLKEFIYDNLASDRHVLEVLGIAIEAIRSKENAPVYNA
ncbi:MAG: hypothetical protein QME32_00350 [Endomicrobiia bacterium]|nr:hypothetical protein [Endomicrobiia bacterium]